MGLYEKMFNVMVATEGLEKNLSVGTGTSSYKAVGEAEVLNMLKPLFKANRLIVFPIDGTIAETNAIWEASSTYNGTPKVETKTRNITQLKAVFKIVDIDSGESEILCGFGNGADSQDKGSGKAFTYAFKTMLSKSFMLFSGEDTDNEHSDDIGKSSTPKANTPKKEVSENDKIDSKKAYVLKMKAGDKFKAVLDYYKVDNPEELTLKQWTQAMKKLDGETEKVT